MNWTASSLEDRVRDWTTSYKSEKLTSEQIWGLMDEAGDILGRMFDIWFLRAWGSITRDADNAIWEAGRVPPPYLGSTELIAADIADGDVPDNPEYLRQIPMPDRLLRPLYDKLYFGPIANKDIVLYLYEDEFGAEYDEGDTVNATPEAYTIDGDTFLLGPIPPFELILNVRGIYQAERLETELATNAWTRNAHELLVYDVQNLLIKYQYEEEARGNVFSAERGLALRSLLAHTGRQDDLVRKSKMQRKG